MKTEGLLENGSTPIVFWAEKYRGKIGLIQRTLHSWWKRKGAFFLSQIDEYVKHIFGEHKQVITGRTWVQKDREQLLWTKGNNTEKWKAVRGFWDGSSKRDGKSGCGVVIKGADRNKLITISKIRVLLDTCTATTAEVVGVRRLRERRWGGLLRGGIQEVYRRKMGGHKCTSVVEQSCGAGISGRLALHSRSILPSREDQECHHPVSGAEAHGEPKFNSARLTPY